MCDRLGHDGQHDLGGMLGVVIDGLISHHQILVHSEPPAGVGVAVVVRKVGAGDFQADAVAGLEQIAGRPK